MSGRHRGASPSTERRDGICPGRRCIAHDYPYLIFFHRGFTIPLHPQHDRE